MAEQRESARREAAQGEVEGLVDYLRTRARRDRRFGNVVDAATLNNVADALEAAQERAEKAEGEIAQLKQDVARRWEIGGVFVGHVDGQVWAAVENTVTHHQGKAISLHPVEAERLAIQGRETWERAEAAEARVAELTRMVEGKDRALRRIVEQPSEYHGRSHSYGIGWAFEYIKSLARQALTAPPAQGGESHLRYTNTVVSHESGNVEHNSAIQEALEALEDVLEVC